MCSLFIAMGICVVVFWNPSSTTKQSLDRTTEFTKKTTTHIENHHLDISLSLPTPQTKHKLGLPLRIQGKVELPANHYMFNKVVFLEHCVMKGRQRAVLYSEELVLNQVDTGVFEFKTVLTNPNQMPRRIGKYEIRVILSGVELRTTTISNTGSEPASREIDPIFSTVTYELIR